MSLPYSVFFNQSQGTYRACLLYSCIALELRLFYTISLKFANGCADLLFMRSQGENKLYVAFSEYSVLWIVLKIPYRQWLKRPYFWIFLWFLMLLLSAASICLTALTLPPLPEEKIQTFSIHYSWSPLAYTLNYFHGVRLPPEHACGDVKFFLQLLYFKLLLTVFCEITETYAYVWSSILNLNLSIYK